LLGQGGHQPPTGTKVALSLFHPYSLRWGVKMNDIEKLDNVTWYGHCVINVMAAISDLPDEAKLVFCQDLEKFIRRQERVLSKA
jgi:hypothetical protein